jgi:hypothetical protein
MALRVISRDESVDSTTQESDAEREAASRETRIHQRQCERCHRWFWAWDSGRHQCFVCDAPPPQELRRILEAIHGSAA